MSQQSIARPQGWTVIYSAHSEPEAMIVAGRLQNEGIETFVHREPVGSVYSFYADPFAEVTVLIHPQDYDQAAAILDEDVEADEPDAKT